MKVLKLLFLLVCFTGFNQLMAQEHSVSKEVSLNMPEKDFGQIRQGKPVTETFYVINKGTETVKIANVFAECGCTTPRWTADPIQPGDSLAVEIGYNAAAEGAFFRKVEIIMEDNPNPLPIILKGVVYPAQATSAPVNSSIVKLKTKNL